MKKNFSFCLEKCIFVFVFLVPSFQEINAASTGTPRQLSDDKIVDSFTSRPTNTSTIKPTPRHEWHNGDTVDKYNVSLKEFLTGREPPLAEQGKPIPGPPSPVFVPNFTDIRNVVVISLVAVVTVFFLGVIIWKVARWKNDYTRKPRFCHLGIENGGPSFLVTFATNLLPGSGSCCPVLLSISGTLKDTPVYNLSEIHSTNSNVKAFTRASKTSFVVWTGDLGRVKSIILRLKEGSKSNSWCLDYIRVTHCQKAKQWIIPVHQNLKPSDPYIFCLNENSSSTFTRCFASNFMRGMSGLFLWQPQAVGSVMDVCYISLCFFISECLMFAASGVLCLLPETMSFVVYSTSERDPENAIWNILGLSEPYSPSYTSYVLMFFCVTFISWFLEFLIRSTSQSKVVTQGIEKFRQSTHSILEDQGSEEELNIVRVSRDHSTEDPATTKAEVYPEPEQSEEEIDTSSNLVSDKVTSEVEQMEDVIEQQKQHHQVQQSDSWVMVCESVPHMEDYVTSLNDQNNIEKVKKESHEELERDLGSATMTHLKEVVKRKVSRSLVKRTNKPSKPKSNVDQLIHRYCNSDMLSIKQFTNEKFKLPQKAPNPVCRSSSGSLCPACVLPSHDSDPDRKTVCVNKENPIIDTKIEIDVEKIALLIVDSAVNAGLLLLVGENGDDTLYNTRRAIDKIHGEVSNTILSSPASSVVCDESKTPGLIEPNASLEKVASADLTEAIKDSVAQCLVSVSQLLKRDSETEISAPPAEPEVEEDVEADNENAEVVTEYQACEEKVEFRESKKEDLLKLDQSGNDIYMDTISMEPLVGSLLNEGETGKSGSLNENQERTVLDENKQSPEASNDLCANEDKEVINGDNPEVKESLIKATTVRRRSSPLNRLIDMFNRNSKSSQNSISHEVNQISSPPKSEEIVDQEGNEKDVGTEYAADETQENLELNRSLEIIKRYSDKALIGIDTIRDIHSPEASEKQLTTQNWVDNSAVQTHSDKGDDDLENESKTEEGQDKIPSNNKSSTSNKHNCDDPLFPPQMMRKIKKKLVKDTVNKAGALAKEGTSDMKSYARTMDKLLNSVKKSQFRKHMYDGIMDQAVAKLESEMAESKPHPLCWCGYKYQIGCYFLGGDPYIEVHPDVDGCQVPRDILVTVVEGIIQNMAEDVLKNSQTWWRRASLALKESGLISDDSKISSSKRLAKIKTKNTSGTESSYSTVPHLPGSSSGIDSLIKANVLTENERNRIRDRRSQKESKDKSKKKKKKNKSNNNIYTALSSEDSDLETSIELMEIGGHTYKQTEVDQVLLEMEQKEDQSTYKFLPVQVAYVITGLLIVLSVLAAVMAVLFGLHLTTSVAIFWTVYVLIAHLFHILILEPIKITLTVLYLSMSGKYL